MNQPPRISIGVPVYNGDKYLSETLDSLLGQTIRDFELIVVDNASTDGTAEICRAYAARDHRVRYVRNEANIGACGNCNRVIRLARGEYFKLAMADDLCHPELLAKCVEVLDTQPGVVLTYAKTSFVDQDGRGLEITDPGWHLMSDSPEERLRKVIFSGHWVNLFYGLMRRRTLIQTRLFPHYSNGDYRLIGELCLRGTFFEIPEHLFFRRLHPQASSQNRGLTWASQFFRGRPGRVELPFWQLCIDHVRTILDSDLPLRSKVKCLRMVIDRMRLGKRSLLSDLQQAFRFWSNAPSRTAGR